MKSHVVSNDEQGIPNTISMDRATPVPTKESKMTRIIQSPDQPELATVSHNTDRVRKEPLEFVVDKVMDYFHTLKTLIYKARWYECTPEEDTWRTRKPYITPLH